MTSLKKIFIGGNFKCNPSTISALTTIMEGFNSAGDFPPNAQVVIAPTSLHLALCKLVTSNKIIIIIIINYKRQREIKTIGCRIKRSKLMEKQQSWCLDR